MLIRNANGDTLLHRYVKFNLFYFVVWIKSDNFVLKSFISLVAISILYKYNELYIFIFIKLSIYNRLELKEFSVKKKC
jgi:hypothetical protein